MHHALGTGTQPYTLTDLPMMLPRSHLSSTSAARSPCYRQIAMHLRTGFCICFNPSSPPACICTNVAVKTKGRRGHEADASPLQEDIRSDPASPMLHSLQAAFVMVGEWHSCSITEICIAPPWSSHACLASHGLIGPWFFIGTALCRLSMLCQDY